MTTSPYMPDMGPEDYAPPEYRLVQPTSQAHTQQGITLGSYYCDQTGEVAERLDMAILRVQRNRTYWISDDLNSPACSSDDRVMPRPGGMYQGPCATCEVNGKGCYPGYNLFCVRLDQQGKPQPSEMFLLRINGTSVFPFRKLWSQIHLNHQDNPWSIMISLVSEMKSNEKGTYWVMKPDIAQEFTFDADLPWIKSLADGLLGQVEQGQRTPQIAASGSSPVQPPRGPVGPRVTLISRQAGQDLVTLANQMGVPGQTVTDFVSNTFGKRRVMELHTGELTMLTRWLQQEFGQTEPPPVDDWRNNPVDEMPF